MRSIICRLKISIDLILYQLKGYIHDIYIYMTYDILSQTYDTRGLSLRYHGYHGYSIDAGSGYSGFDNFNNDIKIIYSCPYSGTFKVINIINNVYIITCRYP